MSLPKKFESIISYLADEEAVAALQTSLRLILSDLHSLASNMKQAQKSHSIGEMAASVLLPSAFKAMKNREAAEAAEAQKQKKAKAEAVRLQKELDKAKAFEMDSGEFF